MCEADFDSGSRVINTGENNRLDQIQKTDHQIKHVITWLRNFDSDVTCNLKSDKIRWNRYKTAGHFNTCVQL